MLTVVTSRRVAWGLALALVSGILAVAAPARAANFTVASTADGVDAAPGDGTCATAAGVCTLRAAVGEANATAGADTITLPAGTYQLTIPNTEPDVPNDNSRGDLDVFGESLTITGAGATTTSIVGVQGERGDRIIHVVGQNGPQHLTLTGLTLRGGQTGFAGSGGAVEVSGDDDELTITDSVIRDNADGGTAGGGIAVTNGGTFTMTRSVVSDNAGGCSGGGLALTGPSTITASTISNNTAECGGGGLVIGASAENPEAGRSLTTIVNSTISGNRAQQGGGGLQTTSPVTLTHVTIANNRAGGNFEGEPPGGGVNVGGGPENPDGIRFENTLMYNNASLTGAPNNCADENEGAGLVSGGGNVDNGSSCGFTGTGDQANAAVVLLALGNYGGPTPTHALGTQSQNDAIDSGISSTCPATDQRGTIRPLDGDGNGNPGCDAGAFELDPSDPPADGTAPAITSVKDAPDPFTPRGRTKKTTKISFVLSEAAAVTVNVENRGGTVVRSLLTAVQKAAGSVSVRWNGKSGQAKFVKPGRYTYRISAVDAAGNEGTASGTVTVKKP
ncbi:MAG TPA: choice-of-anchor Q domain-containing protein [Actinomycetota bacterium]|nr:choice-of-anchor Q domain-containing protein [Actinomycetota bacterium]